METWHLGAYKAIYVVQMWIRKAVCYFWPKWWWQLPYQFFYLSRKFKQPLYRNVPLLWSRLQHFNYHLPHKKKNCVRTSLVIYYKWNLIKTKFRLQVPCILYFWRFFSPLNLFLSSFLSYIFLWRKAKSFIWVTFYPFT